MTVTLDRQLVEWLLNGDVGSSSRAMASVASGIELVDDPDRAAHPRDQYDLHRCMQLLETAPDVRAAFPAIAKLTPEWRALIDRWDELERSYAADMEAEPPAGEPWGTRTYDLMTAIVAARKRGRRR